MFDILPQLSPSTVLQILSALGVIFWQTPQKLPWQQFCHARLSFLLLAFRVGFENTQISFNTVVH